MSNHFLLLLQVLPGKNSCKWEIIDMTDTETKLLTELERLRAEVGELLAEKADLEMLVENITTHSDGVEAQLFLLNRQLKVEICDRQEKEASLRVSEALLRAINKSLQREKADLEIILETTTQHGDLVENLIFSQRQVEQEELFQSITEALPEGILLARASDWVILYANSAAVQLLDLPMEQIIGITWAELCQPGTDFKQLQNLFDQHGYIQNHEMQVKQQDQGKLWLNIAVRKFQLGTQELLLLSCQNISERRQTQEALERSQIELTRHTELLEIRVAERTAALQTALETAARANKSKTQFLANVSHELRTPLNAILGFAQFLQQDSALNPEQMEGITVIHQSSEHLLALINDVLELSKIEAGHLFLKEQSFNLHQELEQICNMLQRRSQEKGIDLILEIAPNVPQWIMADRSKLSQVLINLVGNAIKFTQKGNVTLRIFFEFLSRQNQAYLTFDVVDTGAGMSAAEVKTLFQEFVQISSGEQQKEGTGLGLVISQRFVQLMGGEIIVASIVGKGSVFSFSIGIAIASPSAPDQLSQDLFNSSRFNSAGDLPNSIDSADQNEELPPLKLLLAEDNSVNLKIALRMLGNLGYELDICRNGREALAAHLEKNYELILMDVQMPEMDGMEATRAIRQMEKTRTENQSVLFQDNPLETSQKESLPESQPITLAKTQPIIQPKPVVIIAMTAFGLVEDRRDCLEAGMDDYISKPVRQTELKIILRHWHKIVKCNTKNIQL